MTIARRLLLLVAVPLVALIGFGVFTRMQLSRIEQRSRFVAESRIDALGTLGQLSISFAELRIQVRSYLLTTNQAQRVAIGTAFSASERDVIRLLKKYADTLVVSDRGRRLLTQYQALGMDWLGGAKQVLALANAGRRDQAVTLLNSSVTDLGVRLSAVSAEWIQNNQELATAAGRDALRAIDECRWNMLVGNSCILLLTAGLGWLTFRRIAHPVRALETSVQAIAAGDYAKAVPFTQAADETGGLARSIQVLMQGAAAMEQQRWVKSNAAKLTAELQGAPTLVEFGQRLISGLVPLLGGGVAGFYLFDEPAGRVRRLASYGVAPGGGQTDFFRLGEGLVGQCAQDRRSILLSHLPPGYLQISSGLGGAPPVQVVAVPLVAKDILLGVLELGTFSVFTAREQLLLDELLPVAALSLEVLQRNLRTQELLAQTQEQARQLEEQTEELTQSQEELLAQKEELLAQQADLTAQREQLQVSEERSRLILDSSAEGIFGTDTQGRVTFVNPAACRMLGFASEELIGQPSHEAFHHHRADGGDYPREQCPMFAAYTVGKASRIDDELLWCKDGSGLPVEYGATPILKEGVVVGAVISFTDTTLRKRHEAELRQRGEELKRTNFLADSALDLTKAGYWHVPLDGSGWYNSSERAARIFGDHPAPDHRYPLALWAEHVRLGDEAAAKVTAENFQAAVEGKIPVYDAIYAYQRPVDGRVVWIHALGHVVKDEHGRPKDMFGVTQDITEQKLAQDAARDHAAFLQALVDTIPYPVFYKDPETRFLGCNRAYEQAFGVQRSFLMGKRVCELDHLPEVDRRAYQAEDESLIATIGSVEKEISIPMADGRVHDALYAVSGFRKADGSPGGLIGTLVDVSDRKKVEEIERFNRLALGREQRVLDLKRMVNTLAVELGRAEPFSSLEQAIDTAQESASEEQQPAVLEDAIVKARFIELVRENELQQLFSDFCEAVGVAAAIIDLDGQVIAAARWQRACTDFHRVNPTSCARCVESDTGLALNLQEGKDYAIYRCRNGMTDCASPVRVDGRHVANVFIGQFHLTPPDTAFFRAQARELGMDEESYLKAVLEAPVIDEAHLPSVLGFSGALRPVGGLLCRRAVARPPG